MITYSRQAGLVHGAVDLETDALIPVYEEQTAEVNVVVSVVDSADRCKCWCRHLKKYRGTVNCTS
jgi:hypothetical protein